PPLLPFEWTRYRAGCAPPSLAWGRSVGIPSVRRRLLNPRGQTESHGSSWCPDRERGCASLLPHELIEQRAEHATESGTDDRNPRVAQSELPLPSMGSTACAIRGPRSRA